MSETAAVGRRLHPATLVGRTLQMAPRAVGGMAAYAAVVAQMGLARVILLGLAGALLAAGAALLAWWRFQYFLGDSEIAIEKGVLHRQRRVIPFDRVQDIAIEQGMLARLFGTAKVRFETGGAAADEGTLDSIALDEAQRMRDLIRGWKTASPAQSAAQERESQGAEPLLFAMSLPRLLLAGLFNFSLLFLAGIFAVAQFFQQLGLFDPKGWMPPAEAAAGRLSLAAVALLLCVLLLLGMATGIARTVATDFRFRLTRGETGLRRRRGLFTLSEVVIPIRRVQLAMVESGMVTGRLGWRRLALQTLGADGKEGGYQVAAPLARMEEVLPILAELGMQPPGDGAGWSRGPRRAILRRAAFPLFGAAAATLAALIWHPGMFLAAAILLLVTASSALRWSRHSHDVGDAILYITSGLLRRRLWLLPVEKVQSVTMLRSPLQRALGLATIIVDTAGASPLRSASIVDLDSGRASRLAGELLAAFQEKRRARQTSLMLHASPSHWNEGRAPPVGRTSIQQEV